MEGRSGTGVFQVAGAGAVKMEGRSGTGVFTPSSLVPVKKNSF